jgi:hypothetical protein
LVSHSRQSGTRNGKNTDWKAVSVEQVVTVGIGKKKSGSYFVGNISPAV